MPLEKTNKVSSIRDGDSIVAITNGRFKERYKTKFWDDGFGPVWVYESADFDFGIVRADSFYSAYECVQDEILPPADWEEAKRDWPDWDWDQGEPEGYTWSPNNGLKHVSINGGILRHLTDEDCLEMGIEFEVEREIED